MLTDALGSTLALANAVGTLQTEYTYEPFGAFTTRGAGTTNSLAFTGRESDGTGLYAYRARYYDPAMPRLISEDPVGFSAGPNLYAYARNNPIAFVDPLGLKPSPGFGRGGAGSGDGWGGGDSDGAGGNGTGSGRRGADGRRSGCSGGGPFVQLACGVDLRARKLNDPRTYGEWYGASAAAGALAAAAPSAAGAAADLAIRAEVGAESLVPGAELSQNLLEGISTQAGAYTPTTGWGSALGNLVNLVRFW